MGMPFTALSPERQGTLTQGWGRLFCPCPSLFTDLQLRQGKKHQDGLCSHYIPSTRHTVGAQEIFFDLIQ